jgi:hypothetical protein
MAYNPFSQQTGQIGQIIAEPKRFQWRYSSIVMVFHVTDRPGW